MTDAKPQKILQLFGRQQPRIKGVLLCLSQGFAKDEDVLQETFMEVQRKAPPFYIGSNLLGWASLISQFPAMKAQTSRQQNTGRVSALEDSIIGEMPR